MRTVLISTYELGRQPFGLASPAAWLRRAGVDVTCVDLSRQPFRADMADAGLVALHLPMHTATRLAVPVIERVRRLNPDAALCCYGLYAPLNATFLRGLGVTHILGGEFEADLVDVALGRGRPPSAAGGAGRPVGTAGPTPKGRLPRLAFITPDRRDLPPLGRYAALRLGTARKVVGYTEASRGCKHVCRHCPVVPVYGGQFRVVPADVVLADVEAQTRRGAQHITFGDPDFFNGIGHAMRVVEGLARESPGLTYDVTIKVEHLLKHADALPRLRDTGCLFITSAVESVDDAILERLDKGHTSADVERVVELCRDVGVALNPTLIPFTPWTTRDDYRRLLSAIDRLQLVDHIAPIQLAMRLLVPSGSRLLELADVTPHLRPFDETLLTYPWRHSDPEVDQLATAVGDLVGRRLTAERRDLFAAIWALAHEGANDVRALSEPLQTRAEVPFLNEPWYC